MITYFESYAKEILAKFTRVDKIIKHAPSVGTYREALIKNFLSNFLSKRYSIKTGFVYDPKSKKGSKQTDVLIIDENVSVPYYFQDQNFVIAKPSAVVIGMEIKSVLNKTKFKQAIENCFSFKSVCSLDFYIFSLRIDMKQSNSIGPWYKQVDLSKDDLKFYPQSIYCMNAGTFALVPPKFATNWGHYFIRPSDNKQHVTAMVLSLFLATIAKGLDVKDKRNTNPFIDYGLDTLFCEHGCFRFGKGRIDGKPITTF